MSSPGKRKNRVSARLAALAALARVPPGSCLKPVQAALLLDCTPQHIANLIDEGRLAAWDIAGRNATGRRCLRIPAEALRAFLERQKVEP